MATTTGPPWSLPSPTLPEQPHGPSNIGELASSVHSALGRAYPCLSTGRPDPIEGLLIYETDTDILAVSDGVNWREVYFAAGAPQARMSRTTVQSVATATLTVIVYTTNDAGNRGITTNTTTGEMTVVRPGRYWVRASLPWVGNTTGYRAAIIRHAGVIVASDYRAPVNGSSTIHNFGTVWPVLMAANDVVRVEGIQTSGAALDATNSNGSLDYGMTWAGPV